MKREPSGRPQLRSPTLLTYLRFSYIMNEKYAEIGEIAYFFKLSFPKLKKRYEFESLFFILSDMHWSLLSLKLWSKSCPLCCPVGWECRIYQLHLYRGIRLLQLVSWIWHKPSDDEDLVLEIWEMLTIPSLPLLPGPLWPVVVVSVRVPSMGQIELFNHILYLKPFNCVHTNDWL